MAIAFSRTTRALALDNPTGARLSWLLATLGLGGWLAWFLCAEVTLYEVSSQAHLEVAGAAHPVSPAVAGRVLVTRLQLGQTMAAGAVLVELEATTERLRLREAQAELAAIPAQKTALEREIAAQGEAIAQDQIAVDRGSAAMQDHLLEAAASARYAQERLQRLVILAKDHRIPEIDLMSARADAERASAATSAASQEARQLLADGGTRVGARRASVEALRREAAALDGRANTLQLTAARLEVAIEQHYIRASIAGTLGDVARLEVGSMVAAGAVLGHLVPRGELRIVAEFPPAAVLGRIAVGQHAKLRLEGFPWAQYGALNARVTSVATEIRDLTIRVELAPIPDARTAPLLQHGLPGAVEVAIELTTPALISLRVAGQWFAQPAVAITRVSP